jgi:hypothetical protein
MLAIQAEIGQQIAAVLRGLARQERTRPVTFTADDLAIALSRI